MRVKVRFAEYILYVSSDFYHNFSTEPSGKIVVTFPNKKSYFANDDRFVSHFRRYELFEMKDRLKEAGFRQGFSFSK